MKDILTLSDFNYSEDKINVEKDPTTSGLESISDDFLIIKHRKKIAAVIDRLKEIGLPKKEEQFRLVTRRAFNAIEFLEYICQQTIVTDLKLAVYSINYESAILLIDLINTKKILKAEICMSNLRNGAHRAKEQIVNDKILEHSDIDIFYCSSHAKMMAMKTVCGNYYSIEGSGNHAANSRIEQYVIDNSQLVYEFNCQWMHKIRVFLKGKKELVEKNGNLK
jgi:uncharacterized protein YuzB (UPF0349 family)